MYWEKFISTAISLWLIGTIGISQNQKIDLHDCGIEHSQETYEDYLSDLSAIRSFLNIEYASRSEDTTWVPVYFHVFRESDGTFSENLQIDELVVDSALTRLNEYFAPGKYVFFQLGQINYIDNSQFSTYYQSFSNHLSYVSTALNIYTSAAIYRSQAENPNHCYNTPGVVDDSDYYAPAPAECMNNNVFLKSSSYLSSTFAHEVGHTYGLMHTFSGASVYNNPSAPTEGWTGGYLDHPYDGTYARRELVLSAPDDSKAFPMPNKLEAGDLVGDTPAFCMSTVNYFPSIEEEECDVYPFPSNCRSCKVIAMNTGECTYVGSYRDYNGDELQNPEIGIKNLMSYTGNCRVEFTPGQYERMAFYNASVRAVQYDPLQAINLNEEVNYQGTTTGVRDVSIQIVHPNTNKISRSFTNADGDFQGIIYTDSLTANVQKYGSLPPTSAIIPASQSYTVTDWQEGLNMMDVMMLARYNMGIQELDGYQQLAADVNGDAVVDDADLQFLYRLVIGLELNLEELESPWKFMPEYIAHDYASDFHKNPFGMMIDGLPYNEQAPYLRNDWTYELTSAHDSLGLRGFDAIKVGDIDGSWTPSAEEDWGVLANNFRGMDLNDLYEGAKNPKAFFATLQSNQLEETTTIAFNAENGSLSANTIVFPNPATTGNATVQYTVPTITDASLQIRDVLGRQLKTRKVKLVAGTHQITLDVSNYSGQVVLITLTTQTEEWTERVACF